MINKITFCFCTALLLAAPAAPRAQENIHKLYSDAVAQWLDGRPEDAAGALKYAAYRSSDPALTSLALKDIAVLMAEAGRNGEALPYLAKGELLDPNDFYFQFEKGWNLVSMEKYQDARTAFEKALTLTGDQALSSQARFGMAFAEARLGGAEKALDDLRAVYTRHPYLLSPAAQMMGFYLEKIKRRPHALNFIKESLNFDPRNIQAELDLARLYEDTGFYMPAWQTYYTLHDLDPEEEVFTEKVKKLVKHIKGKTEDLMYWTRMAWPAHRNLMDPTSGPVVKMALYADKGGVPSSLKSFNFISNSDLDIIDTRLGVLLSGKANMQWTITFNAMSRLFEIRDSLGSSARTTANSVRIVPKKAGAVILIKNPELPPDKFGINRSDKEVSGELTVLLREDGFWLINETTVESFISPITASLTDRSKLPEFVKAVAVAVRTRLTWLAAAHKHESREYDLCDSAHCLAYAGMQAENDASAEAAKATRGELVTSGGAAAPVDFHRACGGGTVEGINDTGAPLPPPGPFNLYARSVQGPRDGLLCLVEDKTEAADVTWTLLLRPKWIESRLNRKDKIGYLKTLVPLRRAADGRILSIRAEGSAGTAVIEGPEEVSRVLGAGSLRSTLFSIRPIYAGKYPEFFLLRGIGTGDGKGMCLLGAMGMAARQGASYPAILARYYPLYKVKAPALPPVPARSKRKSK